MALNPSFPNYANGPAGTEVIGWTVVGGQPLYRLPVAYVDTGFGAAFVCEGSTIEAPTYPEGVYTPDPVWESAGTISGSAQVGQTLTFTPGTASGTAPLTETYNWIRYNPNGQSLIVGTGLFYSPVVADYTYPLIVQSVATNSKGSVATQTLPYGPVVPAPPVIVNAGTISSVPVNPPANGVGSISLTDPGEDYLYILGAPQVNFTGDGVGAVASATLAERGRVVAVVNDPITAPPSETGTITYTGEGTETDIVLTWSSDALGDVSVVITNPGSGWTQANVAACEDLTYGTYVITNPVFTSPATFTSYVGVPLAGITLTNGGSGYTVATAVVVPASGDSYGNGATIAVTLANVPVAYPTEVATYSGPTVTGYVPQVSWIWGFGAGIDFSPLQLGGTTYRIKASDVNKDIFVKVTATNTGGTVEAFSAGIQVNDSAPVATRFPKIGPVNPAIGDTLTGQQGTWSGYPTPLVTDWGFAEYILPTPVPIPAGNRVYTYRIPESDEGKAFVFYVTATNTAGTTTAYSLPTFPVFDTIKPDVLPTLTGFQSPAQFGDILKGTPGTFDPASSYRYSYFAYVGLDGSLTEIAGTRNTTTYTLGTPDLGKQIVYATYGENQGKYGIEELTIRSTSTGTIRRFLQTLTDGSISFTGPVPLITSTCQAIVGTFSPALVTPPFPGPYAVDLKIGYLKNNVATYFVDQPGPWVSPFNFTVPLAAQGSSLFFDYDVLYTDYVGGPQQRVTLQRVGETLPAQGVAPYVLNPGGYAPSNNYNPGYTLTFNPAEFSGVPVPVQAWNWYRILRNGEEVLLQAGGLTYTLPANSEGWKIYIKETAVNQVSGIQVVYPTQSIGGPLPVWSRLPVVTGSNLMTPTQGTTLNGIIPQAVNPIDGQPLPSTWTWMLQYPDETPIPLGNASTTYSFANENGRWTGGQVYIQGTATNAVGTVTCQSNKILLQGTPRVLLDGGIGAAILPNRISIQPATSDSGAQVATNTWIVQCTGGATGSLVSPNTSRTVIGFGPSVVSGSQTITNDQGSTNVSFPDLNYTFP